MTPRVFVRLFWKAIQSWIADSAGRHGAAIAYYTLFALAPVLIVVIAIAGLVFGEAAVRGQIVTQIADLIGQDGAQAIQSILQRASEPREGLGPSIIGASALILATTGAFLELQAALNKIWKVKTTTKPGFNLRNLVSRRLRSFGVVVSIGFLLMVSLTVSAAVNALVAWLGTRAAAWPRVVMALDLIAFIVVSTLMFAVLYRVLPDVRLEWDDVLIGALVTAVLFALGQRLIGLYLGRSALASPFGAAGTLVIILAWVYYSTQIVLLGAEFTYHYAQHTARAPEPMPGAVRDPVPAA